MGFSLAAKGFSSVIWKTVALIFVSWAAAPMITGIFGALIFWMLRRFVLRSNHPYQRSVAIYPLTIFLAVGLDLFMVFYKAGKNNAQIKEWGLVFQIPMAWGISGAMAVFFYFVLQPILGRRIAARFDKEDDVVDVEANNDVNVDDVIGAKQVDDAQATETEASVLTKKVESSDSGSDKNDGDHIEVVDDDSKDKEAKSEDEELTDHEAAVMPKNKKSLRSMASKSFKALGDATINRDIEAEGTLVPILYLLCLASVALYSDTHLFVPYLT